LISAIKRQKRVLAIEPKQQGRCFGIPLHFKNPPLSVKLNGERLPGDLNTVITKYVVEKNAPDGLRIYIDNRTRHDKRISYMIGSDRTETVRVQDMIVDHVYDEKYLLANSVLGMKVFPVLSDMDERRYGDDPPNECRGSLAIPSYMPIKLALSNGLVDGTKEEYERVLHEIHQSSKNWNHQLAEINEEVLLYDEYVRGGDYEYIVPAYMKVADVKSVGATGMSRQRHNPAYSYARRAPLESRRPPPPPPRQESCSASDSEDEYEQVDPRLSFHSPGGTPPIPTRAETADYASIPLPPLPPVLEKSHGYVNNIPRASVNPTKTTCTDANKPVVEAKTRQATLVERAKELAEQNSHVEQIYGDLSQVPRDISALNAIEIADCLSKLKLGHYAELFLEEDVDGKLLTHMVSKDEMISSMKESFGMSSLEATKLWLFTHEGYKR
jgi:hypothetical protein